MGEFGPMEMWHQMGIPAKAVAVFLLGMSIWAVISFVVAVRLFRWE